MAIGSEIDSERIEYHRSTVLSVACCHDDQTVLSGAEDGTVTLFSSKDNTLIHHVTPAPSEPVNCVTFNPRETAKFYCALGEEIFVYDKRKLSDGWCAKYDFHKEEINQIAVDEKGQYLVSCDDDGTVICIDLTRQGGRCASKHTPHDNICASVQWVPGRSSEIVSGGMDCKIHHRDVYKARPIRTLTERMNQQGVHIINPPFVNSVSTYPNSRYMVAGYGSGTVKVWRLGSRKVGYVPFKLLPQHNAGAGCVCLVDGKTVVSGGNDGFVHITDLEEGYSNGSADITSDEDADIDESSTFKLLHGHKINWLSGFMDTSTLLLYVCDESSVVTKYSVR